MSISMQSFLQLGIEQGGFSPLQIAALFEPVFSELAEIHDEAHVLENLVENLHIQENKILLNKFQHFDQLFSISKYTNNI